MRDVGRECEGSSVRREEMAIMLVGLYDSQDMSNRAEDI
jgi:hypothetical protein